MPVTRRTLRAATALQRWWRRTIARRDPITLAPLHGPTVWSQGTRFSRESLRDYLAYTGDTRNPVTRQPMSQRVLRILGVDRLAARRTRRAARQQRADLVLFLEREMHGLARQLVRDVTCPERGAGETILVLVQHRFPAIMDAANNLWRAGGDVRRAVQAAVSLLLGQTVAPRRFAVYMIARSFLRDLQGDFSRR
jgi:hypothetical protein